MKDLLEKYITKTIACLTRISYIELSYLKCFLDHRQSDYMKNIYLEDIESGIEIKYYLS